MSKRNLQVVKDWRDGIPADSHTGALWTDGTRLYSYRLQIGDTMSDGRKVLKEYTANGEHGFQSQTTSCHVGLARRIADVVV